MTCNCLKCRTSASTLPVGDGRHVADWNGKAATSLVIGGPDGLPMIIATFHADSTSLLVEPWMVNKALRVATKVLAKCVANYSKDEPVN